MDENELQALYQWVDDIALSRPKHNIARDFSDGVMMAELVKHFFPKLIDLHNYSSAQSVAQKIYNWNTLEMKAFRKLNFVVSKKDIEEVATCVPGAVEKVLSDFKKKVSQIQHKKMHEQQKLHQARAVKGPGPAAFDRDGGGYAAGPSTNAYGDSSTPAGGGLPNGPSNFMGDVHTRRPEARDLTNEILAEKDETINEMKETIEILEVKIRKLEQLLKIKDHKIAALQSKVQGGGFQ